MSFRDSDSYDISSIFYSLIMNENSENYLDSNPIYNSNGSNEGPHNSDSTNQKSETKENVQIIESQKEKQKEQKEQDNSSSDNNNINLDLNFINNINQNNNNIINKKFIGKKLKRPKFLIKNQNPKDSTIFNNGDFDDYSKKIINDALNQNYVIKKDKKTRMYRTDEIINKFLGRFFKTLVYNINANLKISKSKKFFKYLPASYIKKYKSIILKAKKEKNLAEKDYTLENIFSTEFSEMTKKNILNNNIKVLEYLKEAQNKSIYENSNFNIFKDMKLSQIFNQYFNSKEFGIEISILKDDEQDEEYIKEYIFKGRKFFNSFYQ